MRNYKFGIKSSLAEYLKENTDSIRQFEHKICEDREMFKDGTYIEVDESNAI